MAYKIIFTEEGQRTYEECIDYILYYFCDPLTAQRLIFDIDATMQTLSTNPFSFPLCDNPNLAKLQLRKVHLHKHSYKIYYSIKDDQVYIKYVIHDRRDSENLLA